MTRTPDQSGTFVTLGEPVLICPWYPKFTVEVTVYSWCMSYGFGQMYTDVYPSFSTIQSIFVALKTLFVLSLFILIPNPKQPLNFLLCFMVVPFSERHIVGMVHCIAFSDWCLSLSNMHSGFLPIFTWLHGAAA